MKELSFDPKRFVIDSHRGAFKSGFIENSIPAFTESYREGANCVECDIRITKDKQIVLIHNSTIDHIASFAETKPPFEDFKEDPRGPIKQHSLAYLQALKFPNDAKIMTLAEFFDLLQKLKIGAQIELKEVGYEELILKEIESAEISYDACIAPIVCTSFNWFAIRKLVKKAQKYKIPLYDHSGKVGLCFGFQALPIGSWLGPLMIRWLEKMQIWGGMTYYKYMPIKRLKYAHEHGIKFCPRVPDDIDLINAYLDAGVDGFETDNVPLIRKCAEAKGIDLWPLP